VGTVAGAEPTAEVTGLANGHATQVCADAWFQCVSYPVPSFLLGKAGE
jgi:hypothetical protein